MYEPSNWNDLMNYYHDTPPSGESAGVPAGRKPRIDILIAQWWGKAAIAEQEGNHEKALIASKQALQLQRSREMGQWADGGAA